MSVDDDSAKRGSYRFTESTQTRDETSTRDSVEHLFESSRLSTQEKLSNFPKYVARPVLTRFLSRMECFKLALEVQGDVIDCGVLFGGSLMTWANASAIFEPYNSQRRVIGFDTFQGFPSLAEQDKAGTSSQMKVGGFDLSDAGIVDELEHAVALFDQGRPLGHIPKTELVVGDIAKTIPAYLEKNQHTVVSLLHIDVDLYEPTKVALEHFVPRMPKGAVLVFDELNSKLWPGESVAVLDAVGISTLRIRRFSWDSYLSYAVIE